ncbi:hypothetical protein Y032_0017g3349 [Ancylostoma ceylanicum]|uniref:Uncharacterized protein n=1 Tax=Ancylostoma ceylanicum TaxID=53326 RepID=A0A016V6T1_9BILA|nr:hypothetical protein Y032_0017g3349 [Ancylostoma ceylanicum]
MCYRIPISRDSSVGSLSDAVKEEGRRGPIPHECLTANASLGVGDETEIPLAVITLICTTDTYFKVIVCI